MTNRPNDGTIIAQPITNALWSPKAGVECERFRQRLMDAGELDAAGIANLQAACLDILSLCADPSSRSPPRTGLVIGQVQSGKTMSFTGVSCLARDNGVRLVIVVTGVSVHLLDQSVKRLRKDLGLATGGHTGWVHLPLTPSQSIDASSLVRHLKAWNDDSGLVHLRKTVLITVMKNHANLKTLATLLSTAAQRLPGGLQGVPTLVIDDEADQASLNTRVRTNGLSAVYKHLRALRSSLPNHTFLQYTATPQAPLLLNIADLLSPDFCTVLDPGTGYTGGSAFFLDSKESVRRIPQAELGTTRLLPTSVPDSLQAATRIFLLGVAAEIVKPAFETRSMLVHPSVQTAGHAVYHDWIVRMIQLWGRLLSQPDHSPDRMELVREFKLAHDDLAATVTDLPPFDELLARIPLAIDNTQIEVVNREDGPPPVIAWENSPAWILVGGMAMDRGFTVSGLTVTYMPRPLAATGVGNADTLQQRARFFGYKSKYFGYCRVYLESEVRDALQEYVTHEDELRRSLKLFARTDQPLSEWRRRFILDPSMNPTRRNVVDVAWTRREYGHTPTMLFSPHHDPDHIATNRTLVEALRAQRGWKERVGHPSWTDFQTHSLNDTMSLQSVCDQFITLFRPSSPTDADNLNARLIQISALIDEEKLSPVDVYIMSEHASGTRYRTADPATNELPNFLQGANPPRDPLTGVAYPGDREICRTDRVVIQIHIFDITADDKAVVLRVPTLAIFAPNAEPLSIVTQPPAHP